MQKPDKKELRTKIQSYVKDKELASSVLADHFNCKKEEIFYKFLKKEIAESGITDTGEKFFFHGYGCTVKNDQKGWEVDLEFGPRGETRAFDKYTLCHFLGYQVDECESVISFLSDVNLIELADPELYSLMSDNPQNIWGSEEEEIDACVSDRYVMTSD